MLKISYLPRGDGDIRDDIIQTLVDIIDFYDYVTEAVVPQSYAEKVGNGHPNSLKIEVEGALSEVISNLGIF